VLNRYQRIIMAREQAYEASTPAAAEASTVEEMPFEEPSGPPLQPLFRHGDGTAEVLSVELFDSSAQQVELVESGEPVTVRLRVAFDKDVEEPVFGFLIRNRHGIHLYGTNTEIQGLSFGMARRGDIFEITFNFDCWLAPDSYSITVASHSLDAISFDWVDGAMFFRVVSGTRMEGVTNLHATANARRMTTPVSGDADHKLTRFVQAG
jgi:hypothetical protein